MSADACDCCGKQWKDAYSRLPESERWTEDSICKHHELCSDCIEHVECAQADGRLHAKHQRCYPEICRRCKETGAYQLVACAFCNKDYCHYHLAPCIGCEQRTCCSCAAVFNNGELDDNDEPIFTREIGPRAFYAKPILCKRCAKRCARGVPAQ